MDNDYLDRKWGKLSFHGFDQEEFAKKYPSWKNGAKKLTGFLEQAISPGLIADTAAGKTIMALLAIVAIGKRVLFLTPQRLLAEQHQKLLKKMDEKALQSRIIHGHTARKKRAWNDPADRIIFATPHVVMEDISKKMFDIKNFEMVVFDEMHHAVGDYPYVPLAKIAKNSGLLLFGLSASPGGSIEKISIVKSNLFLGELFRVEVETPTKNEDFVMAEMDEALLQMERLFASLLLEIAREISGMGIEIDQDSITNMRIFEDIEKQLKIKNKYQGGYLAAKYRKLYHAYFITITEGYGTLLAYLDKKKKTDGSKSWQSIITDEYFQQVISLAMKNYHPKVEKFSQLLSSLGQIGKNALVFFSEKSTVRFMEQYFSDSDFRIEVLFGGSEKSLKHQEKVLQKIADREVDFVFATSVAEEGLSVPEIDTVIQYSMPKTDSSLIQRSGRTGRMKKGHVIFLTINHKLDKVFYFVAKAKTKKMKKIIKDELFSEKTGEVNEKKVEAASYRKGKNKKWKDESTIPLFPDL